MTELEEPVKSPPTTMPSAGPETANMEGASQEAPAFNATAGGDMNSMDEEVK